MVGLLEAIGLLVLVGIGWLALATVAAWTVGALLHRAVDRYQMHEYSYKCNWRERKRRARQREESLYRSEHPVTEER